MIFHQKKFSLPKIIFFDLINHGLMVIFLFFFVFLSTLLIVHVTYKTRFLISQHEKLMIDKKKLNLEWEELILKYNTIISQSNIEHISLKKIKI